MFFSALLVTLGLLFVIAVIAGGIWVIALWVDNFDVGRNELKWNSKTVALALTIVYIYLSVLGFTVIAGF